MECGILWFNCSLIQSLWTFVEGVFLRLKGRNIKFTSKPCEQNLPDPSGIITVEYGKPPLKVDSLFDGIMENQCKQWIKNAVDSISTRETHAITKNPIDTYPLNILNCYCKVLGPIFQGNPYMTSYSPPPLDSWEALVLALQVQGLNQSHGWNHIQWSRRSRWDSVDSHGPPQ